MREIVTTKIGGRDAGGRQVLRAFPDRARDVAPWGDIEAEHFGSSPGGGGQTQPALNQGGLAGSVGHRRAPSHRVRTSRRAVKRGPRGNRCSGFRSKITVTSRM